MQKNTQCPKKAITDFSDVTITTGGKYMMQENSGEITQTELPDGTTMNYNFIPGISDVKENTDFFRETEPEEVSSPGKIDTSQYDQSSIKYLNGFMRSQIGRNIIVEMLIGTNNMIMRSGILSAVGTNYFILHDADSRVYSAYSFYEVKSIHVPYMKDKA